MANIKQVYISAVMPEGWRELLPARERSQFEDWGRHFGLVLREQRKGHTDKRVTIRGEEGVSFPWLDRIASALNSVGTVQKAWARDVQFDVMPWEPLKLDLKPPSICRHCKAEVGPRPGRHERDTTKFGFGKLWSWAYHHEGDCPVRKKIHADKALEAMEPKIEWGEPVQVADGVTQVTATRIQKGGE